MRFWRDPVKRIGAVFWAVKLGAVMFSAIFSLCEADNREIGLG
jgi:hypothetical protein